MKLLTIAVAGVLALASIGPVSASLVDAVPGQTITRGQNVNPYIEAFLVQRNIQTTNALNVELTSGQVIVSPLDAGYAEWLANGLAVAYR